MAQVISFEERAVATLRDRLGAAESAKQDLIAFARGHSGATHAIHLAVLELMHADPMLSVPLLVAEDLDDVAADWRAWSDAYRLPMLLIEADGIARTLEESLGAVRTDPAKPRRKGRVASGRRPRFLARRKCGDLGLRLVVDGEEIIARE